MRSSRTQFAVPCKSFFQIEFAAQDITAYGGLELVRRYCRLIGLHRRIQKAFRQCQLGGDYQAVDMILVLLALLLVGGRRLEHLGYISADPLVKRFCGLSRLPRETTVARWLKRFSLASLQALVELNSQIVCDAIKGEGLRRVTLDVDGTVITTGAKVAWAFRGFNPHHRKHRSYYALLAHLAQTGHILKVKNRPGNVHDSKGSVAFLRELIADLRTRVGGKLVVEFRMDGAFFQKPVMDLLESKETLYAFKVPFFKWLGLVPLIRAQKQWQALWAALSSLWRSLLGTRPCGWCSTVSRCPMKAARITSWICLIRIMDISSIRP